jgi:hypothetical protein
MIVLEVDLEHVVACAKSVPTDVDLHRTATLWRIPVALTIEGGSRHQPSDSVG